MQPHPLSTIIILVTIGIALLVGWGMQIPKKLQPGQYRVIAIRLHDTSRIRVTIQKRKGQSTTTHLVLNNKSCEKFLKTDLPILIRWNGVTCQQIKNK